MSDFPYVEIFDGESKPRGMIDQLRRAVLSLPVRPIKASTIAAWKFCPMMTYYLFLLENYLNVTYRLDPNENEGLKLAEFIKYFTRSPWGVLNRRLYEFHHCFYVALMPVTTDLMNEREIIVSMEKERVLAKNINKFQIQSIVPPVEINKDKVVLTESILALEKVDDDFKDKKLKEHLFRAEIHAWIIYPKVTVSEISLLILGTKDREIYEVKKTFNPRKTEVEVETVIKSIERNKLEKSNHCAGCLFYKLCN